MSAKKYDVAVVVGEYIDTQGQKKKRYKTIGAVMDGENGPFLLLDATVLSMQLFALANRDRRDAVLASLFDVERTRQDAPPDDQEGADDRPF